MKPLVLLLWVSCLTPTVLPAPVYQHKSEAAIARMTPAERVEEYAEEQARHKYDVSDEQGELIGKYLRRDGLAALPRMIEIMDEYDPTRAAGKRGHRGERFDAVWMLLGDIDNHTVRLRASEEGRSAIAALERAVGRMRAAGFGQPNQHDWERHGRFELALMNLDEAKGVGSVDRSIRDTLWVRHQIQMSDGELLALSNHLVARDPTYPSWSETDFIRDETRKNEAGYPLRVYVMRKPERFYEAYLEFKKTRR